MKPYKPFDALHPMTKALSAPAFTPEREALNVIAESLKFIEEAKAYQEWSKTLPHNQTKERYTIKTTSLIDADVLKTLGQGGSLVDEES